MQKKQFSYKIVGKSAIKKLDRDTVDFIYDSASQYKHAEILGNYFTEMLGENTKVSVERGTRNVIVTERSNLRIKVLSVIGKITRRFF